MPEKGITWGPGLVGMRATWGPGLVGLKSARYRAGPLSVQGPPSAAPKD